MKWWKSKDVFQEIEQVKGATAKTRREIKSVQKRQEQIEKRLEALQKRVEVQKRDYDK